MVSFEWLEKWVECKQYVLGQTVSDHCAIVLKSGVRDWGPKPFGAQIYGTKTK